ncbi:uncharacterized protein LOC106465056 [Limulus polyphemus]|uniref:Uncharacterized protein LOC106465056 n=1 Tax=Limulus polyphemus TaxID=6850 RepID=A0ABM1SY73_LIMPO|nr:uncharacterized protein LOC106465056 [Limulus polyphemus]
MTWKLTSVGNSVPVTNSSSLQTGNSLSDVFVTEKILEFEDVVKKHEGFRMYLEENSKNVKSAIHEHITSQLSLVHQREIQLYRQVDAMMAHQNALLQNHLAQLYQTLGSLKSFTKFLEENRLAPSSGVLDRNIVNIAQQSVFLKKLEFQLDGEQELRSAIQGFGRVKIANGQSGFLPLPEEEDYEDDSHHLFHKTLQDDGLQNIKICFPKIRNKPDEWLIPNSGDNEMVDSFSVFTTSQEELKGMSTNHESLSSLRSVLGTLDLPVIDDKDWLSSSVQEVNFQLEDRRSPVGSSDPEPASYNRWLQNPKCLPGFQNSVSKNNEDQCDTESNVLQATREKQIIKALKDQISMIQNQDNKCFLKEQVTHNATDFKKGLHETNHNISNHEFKKSQEKDSVIQHFSQSLLKRNSFLESQIWVRPLFKNVGIGSERKSMSLNILQNISTDKWLRSDSHVEHKGHVESLLNKKKNNIVDKVKEKWVSEIDKKNSNNFNSLMKGMFETYFQPLDIPLWLGHKVMFGQPRPDWPYSKEKYNLIFGADKNKTDS